MTLVNRVLMVGAVVAGCGLQAIQAEPLRSPWDLHVPVVTSEHYVCPDAAALPRDIVAADFYSDEHHSVIDPKRQAAYNEAAEKFRTVSEDAEKAADRFQKNGSAEAAACVMTILETQAKAEAMTGSMSTNQANYVQNWTMGGLAISYLKVRSAGAKTLGATPEQTAAVKAWMKKVGGEVEGWFEERRGKQTKDGRNNHLYWAGLAVMATGIAADDRKQYDWAVSTYQDGLKQIAEDGTLPLEMDRKARALHYHLFALAPLVTMAEFGAANGQDLYGAQHNRLHLLVSRTLSGLIDNSYFATKAGIAQDTPEGGKVKSSDVVWVTPYLRRFPDPMIAELLKKAGSSPYGYLGGLPPA